MDRPEALRMMRQYLQDVLTGSLEGCELPLVDGALCAAADKMGIVGRPRQAPDLAVVAPAVQSKAPECSELGAALMPSLPQLVSPPGLLASTRRHPGRLPALAVLRMRDVSGM